MVILLGEHAKKRPAEFPSSSVEGKSCGGMLLATAMRSQPNQINLYFGTALTEWSEL